MISTLVLSCILGKGDSADLALERVLDRYDKATSYEATYTFKDATKAPPSVSRSVVKSKVLLVKGVGWVTQTLSSNLKAPANWAIDWVYQKKGEVGCAITRDGHRSPLNQMQLAVTTYVVEDPMVLVDWAGTRNRGMFWDKKNVSYGPTKTWDGRRVTELLLKGKGWENSIFIVKDGEVIGLRQVVHDPRPGRADHVRDATFSGERLSKATKTDFERLVAKAESTPVNRS